jgi:hypothetical protein
MAQVVEFLPIKHESKVLSSNPSIAKKEKKKVIQSFRVVENK